MDKVTQVKTKAEKSGSCGLAIELIQVTRFKQKNDITAAREVKNKIKERYQSLRQAHSKNFPHKSWKWMHNVFTPKIRHAKHRVSDVDVQNIQSFHLSPAVSFQVPIKKLSNNYYLNRTLRAAYKEYVKQHSELKKRVL